MNRIILLRVSLLLVVTILVSRLYQIQLVDTDARRYGNDIGLTMTRALYVPPLRGEVFASDGKTVLAQSVPTFALAVRPGDLPRPSSPRRLEVLARLTQLANLTSTLTLTPVVEIDRRPALRADLQRLLGDAAVAATDSLPATNSYTFTLTTPARTMEALRITRTYSDALIFNDPISPLIATSNVRSYQTVTIRQN